MHVSAKRQGLWSWALISLLATPMAKAATMHVVRYEDHGEGKRRVTHSQSLANAAAEVEGVQETQFPQFIAEHMPLSKTRIVELRSSNLEALASVLKERGVETEPARDEREALDEVVAIVESGPSANRIDLVFMGDGYTEAERPKFFADIQRMVRDMFEGDTYKSYLPLFNVYAVFRASNESGIGRNDRPKDTSYKLARDGMTLRAIYPGDTAAARTSCEAAPGCDYPVIIANDPYYGGLGGEFAISTSSETSGTVVLRHELGHNFGQVGEEYDGGGYFGANWSSSLNTLKWRHWATDSAVRAEPSTALFLAWPWHNLSSGPYTAPFRSDGRYAASAIRWSSSGISTDADLQLTLDDRPLAFASPGIDDRVFYDLEFDHGFTAGQHTLKFTEGVHDNNNWVSSLTVHEYGEGYHDDNNYIGAYPLFAEDGSVDGYRSNHELCLMRNMQSPRFCNICQENNWLEFFAHVKLIDAVDVRTGENDVTVTLTTQKLGQFRTPSGTDSGHIEITWLKNGAEVSTLAGQASWTLPASDAAGEWSVRVQYVTPEVRLDPRGLLKDNKNVRI